MLDCGLLKRSDAREWKHFWTVRGHTAVIESIGRGLYQCWLTLDGKSRGEGNDSRRSSDAASL